MIIIIYIFIIILLLADYCYSARACEADNGVGAVVLYKSIADKNFELRRRRKLTLRMSPSYDIDNLIQASTDPEEAQYAKTSVDYTGEERTRRVEKQRLFFARYLRKG